MAEGSSYISKESYRVSCEDDIMNIPDMMTARELLRSWGLATKGIRKKEEAVKRLIDHWQSQGKTEKVSEEEITNGLQKAIHDNKRLREKLKLRYDAVLDFYRRLPKQHQDDLERFVPDIEQIAQKKKEELNSPECTILVAGETGSGKSSFINLILQADVLPISQLPCTATFCEMRKSRNNRKLAVFWYKSCVDKSNSPSSREIDISSIEGMEALSKGIQEVDEETEESPYDRVEIYYPFPILEEGIVIVDTPGIGESKSLIKHVKRYLEKSFGFIYVVNSSNAGGVQEGRLKDFLRTVINLCEEDFYMDTTMFVCNKWETVPDKYKDEVRIDTLKKLQKFFRNLSEDNLFFMSIDEAIKRVRTAGNLSPEHQYMLTGIQCLLPASLEKKLATHYRFISQILKRSIYTLKVANKMDTCDVDGKQELIENLKKQMDKIQCNALRCVDDLRRGMEYEVKQLSETIVNVIETPGFQERVGYWNARECPQTSDRKKLIRDASQLIENKVALEIDYWERKNKVVRSLKDKIIAKLKRDCELMEDQIREVEGTLISGEKSIISDLHKTMKGAQKSKKVKKKTNETNSKEVKVKSLGAAVAMSGRFDNDKKVKEHFKKYKKKAPDVAMQEASQMFIKTIRNGRYLSDNIEKFLSRYTTGIDLVAKKIPDFIASDQQLLEQIEQQLQKSNENKQDIKGFLRECASLQGSLDMFFVTDIMHRDYRLRDLTFGEELGHGSFAKVFAGTLRQGDTNIGVAIKYFNDYLRPNNVSDVLLEDRTLREMDHKHIVRYYGCTLQQSSDQARLYWIMILEFCECTLQDKVLADDYDNPGKVDASAQNDPKQTMAKYAAQTCKGLEYLHTKDLVHRDLKLANVLVSHDDSIKLADVGFTKSQAFIAGTLAGSPVYMAPEIHMQAITYDRKADIYSLGVMLWEIWYGIDAADHISEMLSIRGKATSQLAVEVKNGLRPALNIRNKPPQEWMDLIQYCWHLEPKKRPEAKHVKVFFEDYLRINQCF